MPSTSFRLWLCVAVCAAGGLSGCATLHLPWDKDRIPQATARNPAIRIVCLWEQGEGRDPDGLPCRGFAGQILFLANRNAMPVQVHGDVRIYLFDDVGTPEEQAKPLRQFDFSSDAWQMHLTKSTIGPSYSVFVPYVRRGQSNAQCSIRVRLSPQDGPTVFSEVTSLPLRGPSTASEATIISEPTLSDEQVQSEVNAAMSQALRKTTTIPLAHPHSGGLALANSAPGYKTAPSQAPGGDRLTRMERLLADVLADRKSVSSAESRSNRVEQASYESLPTDADPAPPRRFKLNQASE